TGGGVDASVADCDSAGAGKATRAAGAAAGFSRCVKRKMAKPPPASTTKAIARAALVQDRVPPAAASGGGIFIVSWGCVWDRVNGCVWRDASAAAVVRGRAALLVSRAVTNSPIEANRLAGSFSRHFKIVSLTYAGTVGITSRGASPSPVAKAPQPACPRE